MNLHIPCMSIPVVLHDIPLYPLEQKQLSLPTHAPLTQGGSQTTESDYKSDKTTTGKAK